MGLARNTHRPKTNNKINKNPTTSYTPISRPSTQHFSFPTFNSFTHSTRFQKNLRSISRSTEHAARSCTRLTNGRDNTTCTRVHHSSVFSREPLYMSTRKHATNALSLPICVLHAYTTLPRSRTFLPVHRWTPANLRVRNHLIRTKVVGRERVHNDDYSRKRACVYMRIYIYTHIEG